MKERRANFFDFTPIYREKIPVNDEICSKISTEMGYDGIKYKYRHPFPHIFRQKSPVKPEQLESQGRNGYFLVIQTWSIQQLSALKENPVAAR